MIKVDKNLREVLIQLKKKKVYLEGSIIKVLKPEEGDSEILSYLSLCKKKDTDTRRKRLDITKQVQFQNTELLKAQEENEKLMEELKIALQEAEKSKEDALNDLDLLQKKSQFELIGTIVKVALWVIIGVGLTTTLMYIIALTSDKDTQIIGSAWSNLFGILLTNAFSIVGTIMGVKYATEKE